MGKSKRYIFTIVAFIALCCGTFAQKKVLQNRPYIDQRQFHYGILVGTHIQDMELRNTGFIGENGQQWLADVDTYNPGFSVGLVGEMRLNNHFSLRTTPSMHFGDKHVTYREVGTRERMSQSIKSTYVSVPIDIKFAAERYNNYRPYVIAGANAMYDLTNQRQKAMRLNKFDCFLEFGMGCDFYMPFFKFIPEIKFCYGLTNLINKNNNDLTDEAQMIFRHSVDKATNKMVVVTFYFE